ncbi:ACT domain-containing protein [Methanosarcina sp. KYL-1]|nr:ACT domain-containing protein [Methanosarcina sp. KYL-1]
MKQSKLTLSVLEGSLGVCRLDREAGVPGWALESDFYSITKTGNELSVVCPEESVPAGVKCEKGWNCLKVEGPLDFTLTGILSGLSLVLAERGISIFAVSTYDTDYILIREKDLENAVDALEGAGYRILK